MSIDRNRYRLGRVAAVGAASLLTLSLLSLPTIAAETAMWGFTPGRNMANDATGLPQTWNVKTGENILWKAALGSQTYAGPLIVNGQIFVGTNNQGPRNPKLTGDRGVIMAFSQKDGSFQWQSTHTKLPAGRIHDWPQQGICSTPFVEGDRLYYISNQCQVVCVDTKGFTDGENDGPITDEKDHSEIDGDVIWTLDMLNDLDVFPHNLATCSPVGAGDLLFVTTSNGVDEGHVHIPSPFAPSFIAVNKKTGEVVWEDASPGMGILHGQWSNPAYGVMGGVPQVVFPGGGGWIYSLKPETGELIWKFDCNPKDSVWELGGRGTRNNILSTPVIYGDRVYVGVGQDPEHGEAGGHLYSIDATGKGDVTATHAVWHLGGKEFNRTMSTAAIDDGLMYITDLSGFLYCLDLETGKKVWTYDAFAAVWGSCYVADGKVYFGDEDGDVAILKAGRKMELLAEINMGSAIYTTPIGVDGVLYIASRNTLFAIAEGK
ncbi:MAG: PQQ-binding-like beta-propeller repeat protein [Candidatus Latescibacterota bacterium]|nr:PQQ-binding-like beta-propeller repeat protein [Candidatus Latescibacterota bacterium]